MAALTHDVGHLPFSHAAEKALLPAGVRHEDLSREIILSEELKPIFADLKIDSQDVAKLAVGPNHFDAKFSVWESILYEMIGGNVFGADRIDYLLRDAYHAGVAYGHFDHSRLIETMRILPWEDIQSNPMSRTLELPLEVFRRRSPYYGHVISCTRNCIFTLSGVSTTSI